MTNLLLALIYFLFGFGNVGEVKTIGNGHPSRIAQNICGFPWPVGTDVVCKGHEWLVEENDLRQLDQ